jgi:hypothetical protein
MKLYAQQGSMEGDKITAGLEKKVIDGIILSPRDNSIDTLKKKIASYNNIDTTAEILFDPQLYAAFSPMGPDHKLGYLVEDYNEYFKPYRRIQLTKEKEVSDALRNSIRFQTSIPNISGLITPNILIPSSLDSIETVISMNFMRLARNAAREIGTKLPLFVTLAINREALFNKQEVIEFVNELTAMEDPPDGFYLLIEARSRDIRSEIFNADIVAFWMYLNYALTLNGFKVINGYSDLISPFLAAANGTGAATGWWSNLRTFSIERFVPAVGGGRLPVQRYLSKALINRITFFELDQLRQLFPEILNDSQTDEIFGEGKEPVRSQEVLQSWDALKNMCNTSEFGDGDVVRALEKCNTWIESADNIYNRIGRLITLDQKSNGEHLPALQEGLKLFRKLAELDT